MKTETKHTPGPWMAEPAQSRDAENCRDFVIGQPGPDGDVVCKVTNPWNDDRQVANAHLIAAAPELLEALQALLPYLTTQEDLLNHASLNEGRASGFDIASVKARAAIAKATGEAR